jgi:hypothetical protein
MQPDLEERLERIDENPQKNSENDTLYITNIDTECSEDTYDSVRVSKRFRDTESGRVITTFEDISYHFNHADGYQVRWAGQPFTLKPGETAKMPRFLGEHFAYHLCNHMLGKDPKDPNAVSNPMKRPAMLARIIIKEEPFFATMTDSVGTAALKQVQAMNEGNAPITEVQGLEYSHGGSKGIELGETTQQATDPLRRVSEIVEETDKVIERIGTDTPEDAQGVPEDWKGYSRKELIVQIRAMDPGYKFPQHSNKAMLVSILKKTAGV